MLCSQPSDGWRFGWSARFPRGARRSLEEALDLLAASDASFDIARTRLELAATLRCLARCWHGAAASRPFALRRSGLTAYGGGARVASGSRTGWTARRRNQLLAPFRERDEDVTLMAVVGISGVDRGVLVVDVGGGRAGVGVPADAAATVVGVCARP